MVPALGVLPYQQYGLRGFYVPSTLAILPGLPCCAFGKGRWRVMTLFRGSVVLFLWYVWAGSSV